MTWHLQSLWCELEAAETWLARGGAHYGETLYDSLGRDVANLMVATSLSAQLTRVQRVRMALGDAGPIAERMIVEDLNGIDLTSIWRVLLAAAMDIAFYLGGSIALGTTGGAVAGAFFGGVGAVPGAGLGAAAGAEVGGWILALLGLKSLAESLGEALPRAAHSYVRGVLEAWGPTARGRTEQTEGGRHGDLFFAASHIADGHVALITALLAAMVAYLSRGKGDRGRLLNEIRQSARLGPKVAEWVAKNEERLRRHPKLKPRAVQLGAGEGPASVAMTPKQIKAAIESGSPAGPAQAKNVARYAADPADRAILSVAQAQTISNVEAGGTGRAYAGHGAILGNSGGFVLPEGTALTTWGRVGTGLYDDIGKLAEKGDFETIARIFTKPETRYERKMAQSLEGAQSYLPGSRVPEFVLFPPDKEINVLAKSSMVDSPTLLRDLVEPNKGCMQWAACSNVIRGVP